jgi:3-deoxy-7-phosphoheptulonate synthase
MIIVMKADLPADSSELQRVVELARSYPGITTEIHRIQGANRSLTELYLMGPTGVVPERPFQQFDCVEKVVRVTQKYRAIGRHDGALDAIGFEYNGVRISQDGFLLFPGLCAVDNRENLERTFAALARHGISTARAGAYKPRTSPYDFQGRGAACLPWVFETAGKHGIKIVAMEITHESQIDEVRAALAASGQATGVMLQIGTRNAQNFELLRVVGQQHEFPVLYKRGMGLTLEESLNACEYIASGGNRRIVFCLRGVKSNLGDPHRNLVDFAHVPAIKRLTRLPVCVDPSHAVGRRERSGDGIYELLHVAAQGVIAGANMLLTDVHPRPEEAMCDGPQALTLDDLAHLVDDVAVVRRAYEERVRLERLRAVAQKADREVANL